MHAPTPSFRFRQTFAKGHTHTRIHACWSTHINCTRQRLRARTRMTYCMHAPNPRFRFKQMRAAANTYMHALTQAHTHTHACCYTHLNDVENACPESTFSIQANVCEGTQTQTHTQTHTHTHTLTHTRTHTYTHAHTRMLVYAHKLYAPAFTCTHQNDVMYGCPESTFSVLGNASRCKHVEVDYASCCPIRRNAMQTQTCC